MKMPKKNITGKLTRENSYFFAYNQKKEFSPSVRMWRRMRQAVICLQAHSGIFLFKEVLA